MYASSGPHAETVELFLKKGAEVNGQGTLEGFTALMTAAAEGQLGTAFTHEGQLLEAGNPVDERCEFEFSLWNDRTDFARSAQLGSTLPQTVEVTEGRFTVTLDFETDVYNGEPRWLEIAVCCGKGTYVRSLARDIGGMLGTGGHCRSLRRTAVGPFTEAEAQVLDRGALEQSDLIPLDEALTRVAAFSPATYADSG